jgi:sugar lactone lactonase YvrE
VADTGNHRVRRVGLDGTIQTVAGTGAGGTAEDGELATEADLQEPQGLALGGDGSLYVATSNQVRRVTPDGRMTRFAGHPDDHSDFGGDGGSARSAELNYVTGLALDAAGNVYLADRGNNRVRKINREGIITTVA